MGLQPTDPGSRPGQALIRGESRDPWLCRLALSGSGNAIPAVKGYGGYIEKLLRHNVCALLYKSVPAAEYDPETVARMRIRPFGQGETLPPIVVDRVLVKRDRQRSQGWDALPIAA
jgi:hypothetical protein